RRRQRRLRSWERPPPGLTPPPQSTTRSPTTGLDPPRPPEDPMFAKTAAFPLFATPVWGFDLPADRAAAVNADLLALLERWFTPRPALRPGETWQTTHRLHERDEFAPLLPFVRAAVAAALEAMAVRDRNWVITGCWANINPAGG